MPRNTAIFSPTFTGEGIVRLDDVLADERYGLSGPDHGMPEGHLPVRSYLAVPVITSDGEVGGDFYDVFGQGDGSYAVVVGDVCGKGPQAAAVTALARYTLRAHAIAGLRPELPTRPPE